MPSSPLSGLSTSAAKKRSHFVRFLIVGAGGTGVHYVVLWVLVMSVGVGPGPAAFAGAAVGAAFNYWLNRRFTFDSARPHHEALPLFFLLAAVSALLNAFIVEMLSRLGLHFMFAQVVATAVVFVLNFLASKKWIFPQRK